MRHPEYYHWIDRKIYTWKFHKTLKEAEHIIAISECTKLDILEFGDYNPEKISVIYQSCNPRFLQYPCKEDIVKTIQKYHLPEQYLLCVGTIEEREERIRLSMEYVQQFKGADLASKMFDVYNCIIK
ncbi:MAG: hypothetical protein IJA42_04535 [Bacteroidales bacterium]|nr:hypothetical protein [Bacteroidales bacterium]